MFPRLVLLPLFSGLLWGQFRNLVTTDDGLLLIFSSTLQQPGTDEVTWDKLFSIDPLGLHLYAQRQEEVPPIGSTSRVSNFYLMRDADLSGDGAVRALITERVCTLPGSGCFEGYYFARAR